MKIDRKIKYDWVRGELCRQLLPGRSPLPSPPASRWLCPPPAHVPSRFPPRALPAQLAMRRRWISCPSCSGKAGRWDVPRDRRAQPRAHCLPIPALLCWAGGRIPGLLRGFPRPPSEHPENAEPSGTCAHRYHSSSPGALLTVPVGRAVCEVPNALNAESQVPPAPRPGTRSPAPTSRWCLWLELGSPR